MRLSVSGATMSWKVSAVATCSAVGSADSAGQGWLEIVAQRPRPPLVWRLFSLELDASRRPGRRWKRPELRR